ncbi:YtrH family sporulation protein [Ectobacillus sp. JY-23]|uniref:YtrH family sporulation protein n=1 Tax=Ectobacillus sp. JY-23 TaxID=2933872 RepID=UPI001FF48B41|nr:YtrH family sporulation protein [Ectobacillus sp. JY-23]UOY94287.1 YtrH family sporulation protein [Ectobacillus sp. JY-23]
MEVKQTFLSLLVTSYFIAFGVMLGGSLIGGLGSFLMGQPPLTMIARFADTLRIWALIAAIGGTFDTFYSLERGLFQGEIQHVFRQGLLILFAAGGMQTGLTVIKWLTDEHV